MQFHITDRQGSGSLPLAYGVTGSYRKKPTVIPTDVDQHITIMVSVENRLRLDHLAGAGLAVAPGVLAGIA